MKYKLTWTFCILSVIGIGLFACGVLRNTRSGLALRQMDQEKYIEFLDGFNGVAVKISVDGKELFSGELQTDPSIAVAKSIPYRTSRTVSVVQLFVASKGPSRLLSEDIDTSAMPEGVELVLERTGHSQFREEFVVDWQKGFRLTFAIGEEGLIVRQFSEWEGRM